LEAAEAIARQLRLRDLGGLVVIDFIDMWDRKHIAEVEKVFKTALSLDRARIQLSRISKFGILELSRQRKQTAIQDISYTACPHCHGSGVRPSLEYIALGVYRKIKSEVVKGDCSNINVTLPWEVSDYLLNQKRVEITHLEDTHDTVIHISGNPDMPWGESKFEKVRRVEPEKTPESEAVQAFADIKPVEEEEETPKEPTPDKEARPADAAAEEPGKKRPSRRRPRRRRRKPGTDKPLETGSPAEFKTITEPSPAAAKEEKKTETVEAPSQKEENRKSPEEKKTILDKISGFFTT
jgi:ribonuclease E